MRKPILSLLMIAMSMVGAPLVSHAMSSIELIENDLNSVTVSVENESTLHVTGAAGQTLYIYNITGVRVVSIKVDSADKSYNFNLTKGCYIVKVGNVVRKISFR